MTQLEGHRGPRAQDAPASPPTPPGGFLLGRPSLSRPGSAQRPAHIRPRHPEVLDGRDPTPARSSHHPHPLQSPRRAPTTRPFRTCCTDCSSTSNLVHNLLFRAQCKGCLLQEGFCGVISCLLPSHHLPLLPQLFPFLTMPDVPQADSTPYFQGSSECCLCYPFVSSSYSFS